MRHAAVLIGLFALVGSRDARGDTGADLAALTAALPACESAARCDARRGECAGLPAQRGRGSPLSIDAARAHCIGIHLHVVVGDGGAIAKPDWLAVQLAAANRHFAPLGVGFQVVGIDALPAAASHIATRRDRDAVADGRLTGKVIHVFITGQLDDVDEPNGFIRGVTWHTRGSDRKYVILSTVAPERVLAHELGHVFGLPHSTYAISIMNKTERAEPPPEQRTFADEELVAMRPVLKRLLRDQVIADVAR